MAELASACPLKIMSDISMLISYHQIRLKYFRAFYNIYQLTFPVPINASIIATKKIQQVTTIPMKMSLMSIIKMIGFVFNFQYGLEK